MSNNSKCEMQQIKGINMEHILCPPCRYKMGITNEFVEYDSGQMFERLSKTSKHGLECHVSNWSTIMTSFPFFESCMYSLGPKI
jgi:hypothetical protein